LGIGLTTVQTEQYECQEESSFPVMEVHGRALRVVQFQPQKVTKRDIKVWMDLNDRYGVP
jgi:hypothetical protein